MSDGNVHASAVAPIVFCYDFPHRKTQDVIGRLVATGRRPSVVLAAPPVHLRVPPAAIRVKPRHRGLIDPKQLCVAFGIPYRVVAHDSAECLDSLDEYASTVGVVAGARILGPAVLERFSRGIINLHPGLLPATRGLDALQWAIYRGQALGVTAHLIDHRVDAGLLLEKRHIDEYPDDTLIDLSLRLYETQLDMLDSAVDRAISFPRNAMESLTGGEYNRSFPVELVPLLRAQFRLRRARLRQGKVRCA